MIKTATATSQTNIGPGGVKELHDNIELVCNNLESQGHQVISISHLGQMPNRVFVTTILYVEADPANGTV